MKPSVVNRDQPNQPRINGRNRRLTQRDLRRMCMVRMPKDDRHCSCIFLSMARLQGRTRGRAADGARVPPPLAVVVPRRPLQGGPLGMWAPAD